uniref:CREB-regulated transcription coactivator 1 n=1 Tax=Cacopsylla melanoneura TaxID=428564 RepID=A0A8D9AK95_9HEMI
MATNPRKFSEKIALHNQKQAAETVEFEKIMREVKDATSKITKSTTLRINQIGTYRGGSLPNVNHISLTNSSTSVELKSALSNLEEVPNSRIDTTIGYQHHRDRGRSIGPMRSSRPAEKRIDTSPYSSGPYLSPPPTDTSWRRTNSDSALHQSSQESHHVNTQRRVTDGQVNPHYSSHQSRRPGSVSPDRRPRSNYNHVPGINIYPSHQEPGIVQIPIGRNSGSLPDLSSFQFTSPLSTPLDQDDTQHSSNPSYSNSPKGSTSPSTLSPTSIPSRSHQGRFSFGNSPPHESPGPPLQFSPVSPLSPNTPNNHHPHNHQQHYQPLHAHHHMSNHTHAQQQTNTNHAHAHQHLSVPHSAPSLNNNNNNNNNPSTPDKKSSELGPIQDAAIDLSVKTGGTPSEDFSNSKHNSGLDLRSSKCSSEASDKLHDNSDDRDAADDINGSIVTNNVNCILDNSNSVDSRLTTGSSKIPLDLTFSKT